MADWTKEELQKVLAVLPAPDDAAQKAAADRNGQLTKPPGALGRLEDLALWLAAWQGVEKPTVNTPQVVIFAGNHGVAAAGVSAFPPEVTVQMVGNFQAGGAAINQLCTAFGARLDVIALDLDQPTQDFREGPAMDDAAFWVAWDAGWNAVDTDADLFITGEMGIGNTTAAAAIAAALYGGGADPWVGRGTGVADDGLTIKRAVVDAGLETHADHLGDPIEVLRRLGGREIVAMAASILRARAERIPVLLDGFICCAAAAVLDKAGAGTLDHAQAAHQSAEGAHAALLTHLNKTPILSLGLRLGEGSGAALALGTLKGAVACHSGMATFAEAAVSAGAGS
ncbi:MAG: nicotinate-nucleotide--dimethylbenzimidazole phosphoribosyltransferase [Planktomarina sp.]